MRVLETRVGKYGFTRRRYETESGERITTYEVPQSVLSWVGPKRLKLIAQQAQNEASRVAKKHEAIKLLGEGWKPDAIAYHLNVSLSTIRKYKQQETEHAQEQQAEAGLPGRVQRAPRERLEARQEQRSPPRTDARGQGASW